MTALAILAAPLAMACLFALIVGAWRVLRFVAKAELEGPAPACCCDGRALWCPVHPVEGGFDHERTWPGDAS